MNVITVTNDSKTDEIHLSFNGATRKAALKAGESLSLNTKSYGSVYVKGATGGDNVRIWGW